MKYQIFFRGLPRLTLPTRKPDKVPDWAWPLHEPMSFYSMEKSGWKAKKGRGQPFTLRCPAKKIPPNDKITEMVVLGGLAQ